MTKTNKKVKENTQNETNTTASKKKIIIPLLIILVLLAVVIFNSGNKNDKVIKKEKIESSDTAYEFNKEGELSFISPNGKMLSAINIEIAGNEEERTQGLMYRDKMNENEGMFFIFDFETPQSFWMKNTLISLDIIFVNKKNEIVKIHKNTDTLSEKSFPSEKPAIYVVEVNAGYCDKFGIKEGHKIVWRRM